MNLGIDFGTTHTVVSVADQGNYPVIHFCDPQGDWFEYFPSLIALSKGQVKYGFEAQEALNDSEWTVVRSLKSQLKHIHQQEEIIVEGHAYQVIKLMIDFFSALNLAIQDNSSLKGLKGPLRASLAVPANTQNTQRFLTEEAAIGGGFDLVNLFNEPSAVTVEYAEHYFKNLDRSTKKYLLVYDLGGGTFDCSVALLHDQYHQILATEGIEDLGGDQFDEALAGLVLQKLEHTAPLSAQDTTQLLELCREKKEAINPHSKTILIESIFKDSLNEVVRIDIKDYYNAVEPLVDRTLEVINRLVEKVNTSADLDGFTGVYLVGGMSNFPLIARKLRTQFGQNKIKKSHYCQSAVALGLAILDGPEPLVLKESLTRYFGLWREAEKGEALEFDTLFEKDHPLPTKDEPETRLRRRYKPSHNIGLFRFQECSSLSSGQPKGLVTVYKQIYFPFEPSLQGENLSSCKIIRTPQPMDFEVEEIYTLNHRGEIQFKVINHQNGFTQSFQLSPMSSKP